jgi:hypothetical protein
MRTDNNDLAGDWGGKLDTSGNRIEPTAPSHQALIRAIEQDPGPPATADKSTAVEPYGYKQDWGRKEVAVRGPKDWDYTPDGIERVRDAQGRYLSKSDAELRAQWAREGGIAHIAKTVMSKEQTMYAVAPSLQAKVTEHLDKGFLMKAADHSASQITRKMK